MAFSVSVPNVPGVPSVTFAVGAGAPLNLLAGDAISIIAALFGVQQWGIYFNGFPVVLCDNVISIGYRAQWNIASYPIEGGSFESYDKVTTPFSTTVVMTAGGSQANRAAFLASIFAIKGDLNLYDVVTPEQIYASCNVSHVDLARNAYQGAGLVAVEVTLEEIRITATQAMSNTKDPGAAAQTNDGPVQTSSPTNAQAATAPADGGSLDATAARGPQSSPTSSPGVIADDIPAGKFS